MSQFEFGIPEARLRRVRDRLGVVTVYVPSQTQDALTAQPVLDTVSCKVRHSKGLSRGLVQDWPNDPECSEGPPGGGVLLCGLRACITLYALLPDDPTLLLWNHLAQAEGLSYSTARKTTATERRWLCSWLVQKGAVSSVPGIPQTDPNLGCGFWF